MQMTTDTRRFHAADPIGVYWLAHCEGFTVASPSGKPVATVDDRVFDPTAGETVALAISRGKRQSLLPKEAVTTVVPAANTLLVDAPTYQRLRPTWSATLERAAATVGRFATDVAVAAVAFAAAAVRWLRDGRPHA
jgi:sporulation protein YlmC with PRC-barrel domain